VTATGRSTGPRGRTWTVDVDVDVAATPLTNTFPIRRLAHLAVGRSVTSTVAWVDVPALGVTRVEQTYQRLEDRDELAAWRYSDPTHGGFVLTVDTEGLVVDYEGVRPTHTDRTRLTMDNLGSSLDRVDGG